MSKGIKDLIFYISMILIFGFLISWVIKFGSSFEVVNHATNDGVFSKSFDLFKDGLKGNIQTPIAMLLLQVVIILFIARIFGILFVKIGQPIVIGEILAGIVLGPSVLGLLLPEVFKFLFSPSSLVNINILSQIGLVLFMFVIGMELNINEVKKKFNETILISHASIIIPFFFGTVAAYWTYSTYASQLTPFISYAMFIGIAMSITAFPVLARIIQEKRLTKSHLGTITLASAANDDITAWCLLAVVIAIVHSGTFIGALYVVLFTILFLLFMFLVLRPFLNFIGKVYRNQEVINKSLVAFMFLILILSAYTTEVLGIHALFGAFMAGVVMPSNIKFRKIMTDKVEDVALSIFLPLFFVSTGLKTQIGLIATPGEWAICFMFIAVAVIGKMGGAVIASRFAGETWRNSWSIGALMNTRGLMELVVLTIGYEMNIIPQTIFVMLVLMTLVTTFMTGPTLNLIDYIYDKKIDKKPVKRKDSQITRILISFGRPESGSTLLNLAYQLFHKGRKTTEITALHLTVGTEFNPLMIENFEETSFTPIKEEAERLQVNIIPRYNITNDAAHEIVNVSNNEHFDFLLVGVGISLTDIPDEADVSRFNKNIYQKKLGRQAQSIFYTAHLLKDKTITFIKDIDCTVGIFVNRGLEIANSVLIILEKQEDSFLLEFAKNLIASNNASITLCNISDDILDNIKIQKFAAENKLVSLTNQKEITKEMFLKTDLMLVSYDAWDHIFVTSKETLNAIPSTLIIRT